MTDSLYGRMTGKKIVETFHHERGWEETPPLAISVTALQSLRTRKITRVGVRVRSNTTNPGVADFTVAELLTITRQEKRDDR